MFVALFFSSMKILEEGQGGKESANEPRPS